MSRRSSASKRDTEVPLGARSIRQNVLCATTALKHLEPQPGVLSVGIGGASTYPRTRAQSVSTRSTTARLVHQPSRAGTRPASEADEYIFRNRLLRRIEDGVGFILHLWP
jgi:hypothetical protein